MDYKVLAAVSFVVVLAIATAGVYAYQVYAKDSLQQPLTTGLGVAQSQNVSQSNVLPSDIAKKITGTGYSCGCGCGGKGACIEDSKTCGCSEKICDSQK